MEKKYRCVATSLEGFIQQLAVSYVGRGYWWYVTGRVPPGKNPAAIDEKLISRYSITWKKWERARRKELGQANLQYIRFRDFFVLLASEGEHIFKHREAKRLDDARRKGIKYGGYLVSFRNGHVQVRLDDKTYRNLKAYYVGLSTRRRADSLIAEFYAAPFEPYSPVKRQMFNILREVNRTRKTAGLTLLPSSAIWLKRRIVKPFEPAESVNVPPEPGNFILDTARECEGEGSLGEQQPQNPTPH